MKSVIIIAYSWLSDVNGGASCAIDSVYEDTPENEIKAAYLAENLRKDKTLKKYVILKKMNVE